MSLLREIIKTKSDEKPDTTDMPKLDSEESAAERRKKKSTRTITKNQIKCLVDYQFLQLN